VLAPSRDPIEIDHAGRGERDGGRRVVSRRKAERFEMFFCHEG
jgi:hypothetical protein